MGKLRKEVEKCAVAPSRIPDSCLCFEVLTGNTDWIVPPSVIPVKSISKRDCRVGFSSIVSSMSNILRESRCEQGLYLQVACSLVETVELYGAGKSTDYAVIIVSVSF